MNTNVSKYKVIKNFENHLKMIQELERQKIEISIALNFDLDNLKSVLRDFNDYNESIVESFFNDLQSLKESQKTPLANGFHLKEFEDFHEICNKLIELEITLDDTITLDDENIRILLKDCDNQSQISQFISVLKEVKCSKNDEICNKESHSIKFVNR